MRDLHTSDCFYRTHNGVCDCHRGPTIKDVVSSIVSLIEAKAVEWEAVAEKTRGNVPHERYKPTIDTLRDLAKQIGELK